MVKLLGRGGTEPSNMVSSTLIEENFASAALCCAILPALKETFTASYITWWNSLSLCIHDYNVNG